MLPLLVVTALAFAPAASVSTDTTLALLGQPMHLATDASGSGVEVYAESAAGWQLVSVSSECLPDLEAACDTVIDCEPGTANCFVTRHPRPPFPCHRPDPRGPLICDFPNQTGEEPPEPRPVVAIPACGDVLSPGACALVPEGGEDAAAACHRYFAATACAGLPAAPEPPAIDPPGACREVAAPRLCQATTG